MPHGPSQMRQVQRLLGQFSRLWRFALVMREQNREAQAQGLEDSAQEYWVQARMLYDTLSPAVKALFSDAERDSVLNGVLLPHSHQNRRQIVTQEVYEPDPATEQALADLRLQLQEVAAAQARCNHELEACHTLTDGQREQLVRLQADLARRRRGLEAEAAAAAAGAAAGEEEEEGGEGPVRKRARLEADDAGATASAAATARAEVAQVNARFDRLRDNAVAFARSVLAQMQVPEEGQQEVIANLLAE